MLILLCLVKGSVVFARDNTVTDHRGRTLVVETPFTRIISLYGAHTENLFYLGARDNTLGVSVNDTYPEAVKTKQRFSYHDDPEKFIAVKPDLVLIRPMIENGYPQFVRQLQSYGITVLSFQPATIADVYNYWLNLGILTGRQSAAKTLVARFQDAVREIQQATAQIPHRKKVYFQAIHTRMRTFTPGAMPIFALETAGGINVAADARASRNTNIAVYGKEQILAKADTIDVFLAQKGIMNPVSKADILEEPGFHIIKAVKNNQVYLIEESIVSRPVPRLYQGITAIGRLLYPEIFNSIQTEEDFL
ncbi:MAG: ABC transporter substrate-binding protein [Desulfobacter sp.]